MDLQGTPIGSSAQGTKNTSNPKQEAPGPVAPDSLAAESTRDGGAFSDNRNGGVSGSSSNLVNTEFSSATTLAPAPDAAEREAKAAWQETADELKGPGGQKYPEGAGGQGEFPGSHNADGYSGGSTKAKQELLSKAGESQGTGAGEGLGGYVGGGSDTNESGDTRETSSGYPRGNASETSDKNTGEQTSEYNTTSQDISQSSRDPPPSNASDAPGYVASVTAQATQSGKPKGKNLTEGGFDDTDDSAGNNASFTADIGSENDPGRAAEQGFQRTNAAVAGSGGPRQDDVTGKGQYDVLEKEQSL